MQYNDDMNKDITIVTHNGSFHADDVFAVATLHLAFPDKNITVIRSRDAQKFLLADFLVDVGGSYDPDNNKFDHHQTGGAGVHDNGIPYASFGLVWKKFGNSVCDSQEVAHIIENKIVMFVDAVDNGVTLSESIYEGVRPYTISDYLYSFWIDEHVSNEEVDQIFHRVMSLAKDLLKREINKAKNILNEGKEVLYIYESSNDKRIIVLDSNLAWGNVLIDKVEPLVVVYPSLDGLRWNAKAVRKSVDTFESRIQFPIEWAGKMGEELVAVTGVPDALFCHNQRFMVSAKTKEGALALVSKIINNTQ